MGIALGITFGSAIGRIAREETIRWKNNGLAIVSQEMKHNMDLLKQEELLRFFLEI